MNETPDAPLPITRPATPLGWAPPYTDTPDEITRRRAEIEDAFENHRWRASLARKAADAEWDAAIRAAAEELAGITTDSAGRVTSTAGNLGISDETTRRHTAA